MPDASPPHPAVLSEREAGLTRRRALLGGAGLGVAALGGLGLRGLVPGGASEPAYAASCTLARESTEGPFFLDLRRLRADITEGAPGLRLDLRIRIVDARTCKPMRDVAVDLWHADARGRYSGIASERTKGETYLRGIQLTDARGLARLRTIYPGWYDGRATHIHVSTYVGGRSGATYSGGRTAYTGQLYFDDATTERLARIAPYSRRDVPRVRNAADGLFRQGGKGQLLALRRRGSSLERGLVGTITLGIDRS